jgi:hypothetical protein
MGDGRGHRVRAVAELGSRHRLRLRHHHHPLGRPQDLLLRFGKIFLTH